MINIKADKAVKEKAQKLARELGLPLSTMINSLLKQVIRNGGIYFSTIPQMTPELELLLGEVEADIAAGRNLGRAFSNAKEMDEYLDAL